MRRIIKYIIIIILFLIFGFIFLIIYRNNKEKEIEMQVNQETIDNSKYDSYYSKAGEGWLEVGYLVAKKNGNWDRLYLSDNFRKKYNEKDGILGNIQFDDIEYRPYAGTDKDYYFKDYYTYFVITQGKSKTAYIFDPIYLNNGQLDDVKFGVLEQLYDKNGKEIKIEGNPINEDNFSSSMYWLAWGYEKEDMIGVTPAFHTKYPRFLDVFIHYSPIEFNKVTFIDEGSSFTDKVAYFMVDSTLECKKRTYKVKFTLNKDGYLDTAEAEVIKVESYKGNGSNTTSKIFYLHSNWENIRVTNTFRSKHKEGTSVFPDIEKLDFNFAEVDYDTGSQKLDDNWVIYAEYLNDGHYHYYLEKTIYTSDDLVDDVLYERLDYIDMDSKEAKRLYLESLNK